MATQRPVKLSDHGHGPEPEHHGDAHDHADDDGHEHEHALDWLEAARIGFVAVAAGAVWFRLWEPFAAVSVLGVVGVLVGGWPIFREAAENMLARRMTMEL